MTYLAWRQLMARKKQTALILLGISLGTLLFVGISGVQLGSRVYLSEQLMNNTAHILISGAERDIVEAKVKERLYPQTDVRWIVPPSGKREESRLENYGGWYQRLSEDPNVIDFSPRLVSNVLLSNGKFNVSVGLIGTIAEKHLRISSIEKYIKHGNFRALSTGGNHIVLGSEAARNLGARLDQFITVNAGGGISKPFKVVGIVHFGNKQIDETIAFAELTNVQVLNRSPGRVTQIAVALHDIDAATEVADNWQLTSNDKVEDWQEANKMFMEMFQIQDFVRYFITTAVLIVAAFGIYNVLTIMINQKRREIAILRAIGYGPSRILQLILYQGLFLGFVGGLLGLILGYAMCVWVGSIDFNFEIGGSNHLPVSYDSSIYIAAFIAANVAAIIASLLPAWSASRMTPMDIIRSE